MQTGKHMHFMETLARRQHPHNLHIGTSRCRSVYSSLQLPSQPSRLQNGSCSDGWKRCGGEATQPSALHMIQTFHKAGFPPGVVQCVTGQTCINDAVACMAGRALQRPYTPPEFWHGLSLLCLSMSVKRAYSFRHVFKVAARMLPCSRLLLMLL